ncbi:MAG: tyrosine-type recombinase/integrase [Bdellovibrionia bacterium]
MKKVLKKKRLGLFLLKGFRKPKNKFKRKKIVYSSTQLRLSRMRSEEPEVKKSKRTPPPQATPSEVIKETAEPVAQVLIEEITPQIPSDQRLAPIEVVFENKVQSEYKIALPSADKNFLSTLDITKPDDKLKQSIEAFLLDQRSPHTRRAYGKDLKRFVKFLHSRNLRQGADTLTRTVLIGYKESLLSDGLQHTSIDRHLATLRSFFKWLVDDGILEKSPADGVRFLNPKKLSTTIGFSDEEVRKILTIPDLHKRSGAQHYAILMVLFYCGLRRSELCSLKISNLGTERNLRVLRLRGKGNAERMIVLTDPVWNALKHYFYISRRDIEKTSGEVYLFSPIRNNRTGVLDKPLDTSTIFSIVTRYAKQAGIMNRVSPHSCRATAISNARDHHVPDRAIQEFAGWASPDMITRYDKRRTSLEESATHSIKYGSENRSIPVSSSASAFERTSATPSVPKSIDPTFSAPLKNGEDIDWAEDEK